MNMSARLLLVSALFLLAKGRQLRSKEETLEMIHSLLSSPQSLARYSGGRPLSFSFSDCGTSNAPIVAFVVFACVHARQRCGVEQ